MRTWFLDPTTRMNPNLAFGQGVPGRSTGRKYGIIDGHHFVPFLDAVRLLRASEAWTDADDEALRRWFGEYHAWLTTSRFGREIAEADNNHATWYAAQRLWVQAYADPDAVRASDVRASFERLMHAFADDGSQPEELARTLSLSYSVFNLNAQAALARLGEVYGLDLWDADPRLGLAYEGLRPHLLDPATWEHEQVGDLNLEVVIRTLLLGGHGLDRPDLRGAAASIAAGDARVSLIDLTAL